MMANDREVKYLVPGLERGLQLLLAFGEQHRDLTFAELHRLVDMPKATAYRVVQTLEFMGFLERNARTNTFSLGMNVLRLGFEYIASLDVAQVGQPVIEQLRDVSQCSSHLAIRDGRDIIYIARVSAAGSRINQVSIGTRLPVHCTSLGRMLLTDILRTEWNFKGFVMSDWGAVADRVKGVAAGLDLEMPGSGGVNDAKIVAAVKAGTLSEAALDKAVIRILNIVFRAADEAAAPAPELDLKGDHTIAAELAKECAVLLQNRGVLPLKKGSKVVYIGGFAKTPRYQGGGSSHINTIRVDSALEMAESHGRRVSYVEGFPADLDQREEEEFLRAVSAAAEADAAVIFAGLPESFESEGFDRSHMRLPESQNNLIARVAAVQKNTVVVLHTGSPVECPWANDVNAVLCMYLGGEGVGAAADALLWGDANPSGRLPETWPLRLEDTPCYLDFPGDGRHVEYREGVYVGYRWYDARKMPVLWPFGHGLSYTGFVYRNAQLTADEFAEGDSVRVRVSVKNVGMMPGKEVVQLYVADCTGTTGRPPKELRKFVKVKLEPGEEKQVEFTLTEQDLSYYDETLGSWYAAPGEYKILLGHSSRDIHATLSVRFSTPRRRPFVIDENTTIGELSKDDRTAGIIQQVLAQAGNTLTGGNAGGSEIASSEAIAQMLDSMPLRGIVNFGGPAAAGMITPLLEMLRAAIQ